MRIRICIILGLFVSLCGYGQTTTHTPPPTEWQQLRKAMPPVPKPHAHHAAVLRQTKGIKKMAAYLFVFYKYYISSQDGNSCSFKPTCSEFAMQAVRAYGSKGLLMASDRLMRCNGLSSDLYARDSLSGRLLDPVPPKKDEVLP
ncbi:membrane protein insertion efficiency factor YidD [Flexibacter flexilis]|nr:membrane protein insertion efficiency factor YidD [Flexibacter flexilis]